MKRVVFMSFLMTSSVIANAQCSMCRAVLESEVGQATAKGVNNGIVYLMVIPYILIGGLAVFLYRYLKDSK